MVYKIAIDGPAGSGKSTTACLLRKRLGYKTINSGSIYRAVAYVLDSTFKNADLESKNIRDFVNLLDFDMFKDEILYNNHNISNYLRSKRIDEYVSLVAKKLYIRKKVGNLQNKFIKCSDTGIIIEGRDIGTNVLPDATLKIYLDASPEVRAKRRFLERPDISYEDTLAGIIERDYSDKTREHGALVVAEGAIIINTDDMSTEEVVDKIFDLFQNKIN